jgi:hypothetical protein
MDQSGLKAAPSSTVRCTKPLPIGCTSIANFGSNSSHNFIFSNGMVSLAFQLNDQRLIGQVRSFLDWTLDHQGEDGWLGPEPFVPNATIPRLVWPRYLLLLGLIVRLSSFLVNATINNSHSNTRKPTRPRRPVSLTPCTNSWTSFIPSGRRISRVYLAWDSNSTISSSDGRKYVVTSQITQILFYTLVFVILAYLHPSMAL